jgi:hypothetical protein
MPDRHTEEAVAEAAPLEAARRVRSLEQQDELGPRLDAVAAGIDLIRRELRV